MVIIMKKIIAIISVITMLLALAVTPISAATYENSLDYAFGTGTGVKVFAASNAFSFCRVFGI